MAADIKMDLKTLKVGQSVVASTPAEFIQMAKDIEAAASTLYKACHTLKFEMDSWGSLEGKADFTHDQKAIYDENMKVADSSGKAHAEATQLLGIVRKYAK
jgi:hypothetical protein